MQDKSKPARDTLLNIQQDAESHAVPEENSFHGSENENVGLTTPKMGKMTSMREETDEKKVNSRGREVDEDKLDDITRKFQIEFENGADLKDCIHDDIKYEEYNMKKNQLQASSNEQENEYIKLMENYSVKVKRWYDYIKENLRQTQSSIDHLQLKEANLSKEIIYFNLKVNESYDEIKTYKTMIKDLLNVSPSIRNKLNTLNPITAIQNSIKQVDLCKLPKFEKHFALSDSFENIRMLRNEGGDYLKKQASILYYLNLLKERYTSTPVDTVQQLNSGNIMSYYKGGLSADFDVLKSIEKKIKIHYDTNSAIISLSSEKKKKEYTFHDLKIEACEMWNIPVEERNKYHIVNEKLFVFSSKLLVWNIHTKFHAKHQYGEWEHYELLDHMSIFMEKDVKKNKKVREKPKLAFLDEMDYNIKAEAFASSSTFISELVEFVIFYRRVEAIFLFFKRDKELKVINDTHKANLLEINQKLNEELKGSGEIDSEDDIKDRAEFKKNKENQRFRDEKAKYLKKREPPIYISSYTIFKYRLVKFWYFILNVILAISFFYVAQNNRDLSLSQMNNLREYVKYSLFLNSEFQNFFHPDFMSRGETDFISTKRELLIWLNVLFNNLFFGNSTESDYNFFFKKGFQCEMFLGTRFSFFMGDNYLKNESDLFLKLNQTLFNSSLSLIERGYNKLTKDDAPKRLFISQESFETLQAYEDKICDSCLIKKKILYYNTTQNVMLTEGVLSDYEGGGFMFNIAPSVLTKSDFNKLIKLWRDMLISNSNLRALLINMNLNFVYQEAFVKTDVLFEFSTIGEVQSKLKIHILDTYANVSPLFLLFYKLADIQKYIFLFIFALALFSAYLTRKRLQMNFNPLIFDSVIAALMIYCYILNVQYTAQLDKYGQYRIPSENANETIKNRTKISQFTYVEFQDTLDIEKNTIQFSAILTLLLFIRLLFSLKASPLVAFFIQSLLSGLKNIFNIFVVLFVFMISFSLIMHVILGQTIEEFASFGSTVFITFFSLLGSLDTSRYGELTFLQYSLIVGFLLLIKFFLYVFVYAQIKETMKEIQAIYNRYKKSAQFKLLGDSMYEFSLYCLLPISLYFMVKKFLYMRRTFGKVDIMRVIEEEDDLKQGFAYQKMDIDRRDVYFLHKKDE